MKGKEEEYWPGWFSIFGFGYILIMLELLLFVLIRPRPAIKWLKLLGMVTWGAAAILWIIPVITFKRKGKIEEGKSFINTTVLVDSGIYGIIRHPQYLASLFLGIAIIFFSQHWLFVVIGVPAVVLTYLGIRDQDHYLIRKFGEDYQRYMERVPRINFLPGIFRLFQRRRKD